MYWRNLFNFSRFYIRIINILYIFRNCLFMELIYYLSTEYYKGSFKTIYYKWSSPCR